MSLTEERKKEHALIMSAGNTALKQCASMLGMDNRSFRVKLFNDFDPKSVTPEQLQVIQEALPKIHAVKQIENEILKGYTDLVWYRVWKLIGLAKWSGKDKNDLANDMFQEGSMSLLHAIYHYDDTNFEFTTCAQTVIDNDLKKFMLKMMSSRTMIKMNHKYLALFSSYEKTKRSFNRYVTHEEICEAMNLTPKLRKLIERVYFEQVILDSEMGIHRDEEVADYTEIRAGIENEEPKEFVDSEILSVLDHAGLNHFERIVLDNYLISSGSWMAALARKLINPKTNRNFSRMHIGNLLKSGLRKVREAYKSRKYRAAA